MSRKRIAALRRSLLLLAVGVAVVSAGIYLTRRWRIEQARLGIPTSMPAGVQQQTSGFKFARSEGGRTVFEVAAGRSEEREDGTVVLEDVTLEIYGRDGERADRIRASSCEYDSDAGLVQCPGEVEVLLRPSAEGSEPAAGLRIQTEGLQYNAVTAMVWTESPVRFSWPRGEGSAGGLRFNASEGTAELPGEVHVELGGADRDRIAVVASGVVYSASAGRLSLAAPLSVEFPEGKLDAGHLHVYLDDEGRTTRIEAVDRVRLVRNLPSERWKLEATGMTARYTANGGIEIIDVTGPMDFSMAGPSWGRTLHARNGRVRLDQTGTVEGVRLSGDARVQINLGGKAWMVRGGRIEWTPPSRVGGQGKIVASRSVSAELRIAGSNLAGLTGENVEILLAGDSPATITASRRTELWLEPLGGERRTSRADELRLVFNGGDIVSAEQRGDVALHVLAWRAKGDESRYDSTTGIVTLEGAASIERHGMRTSADHLEYRQRSEEFVATGRVRSVLNAPALSGSERGVGEVASGGAKVVRLAAEGMTVASDGVVRYSGDVRMWRDDNRLTCQELTYAPTSGEWAANGDVKFHLVGKGGEEVRLDSSAVVYRPLDDVVVFEQEVTISGSMGRIIAPQALVNLEAGAVSEKVGVVSVVASGGVLSELGGREIHSEAVEFFPSAGKVVFSGNPEVKDPSGTSTSASRLTLFLADGTLLAESENGTRTITRRPSGQ